MRPSGGLWSGTYAERFKNYRWKSEEGKAVLGWKRWVSRRYVGGLAAFLAYAYLFLAPTPDLQWDRERRWAERDTQALRRVHGLPERQIQRDRQILTRLPDQTDFADNTMTRGGDVYDQE